MKKYSLEIVLVFCTFLFFTACTNKNETSKNESGTTEQPITKGDSLPPSSTPTNTTQTEPTPAPVPVADESYTFDKGRMGKAKIGMDKKAFFAVYPDAKKGTTASEGGEIPTWEVKDTDGKLLFSALLEEGKVSSFMTENPKMQNPEKIHFGSSYNELKSAYKDLHFFPSEGIAVSVKSKPYFNMMISGVEGDFDDQGTAKQPTKVEKDAKVGEIWVYN